MLKGEEREQEIGNLFQKIRTENFPNLVKEIDIQVHKVQIVLNKINPKRPTPRHIIIKIHKVKDKENLQGSKRKAVNYQQGSSQKTVSSFLNRNLAG